MFDSKKIKELEGRINEMQRQINHLRDADRICIYEPYMSLFRDAPYAELNTVVRQIVAHLGLEIKRIPSTSEYTILEKKPKAK